MALDAVLRNIEVIGEAIKNIPQELKDKHKEIEWKKIIGIRDILTHAYFGIDKDIIADIIAKKLPELKVVIIKLIKNPNL